MITHHKNDVLSTAFCHARYSKGMEQLTGFGMKNSLTLPSLAKKCFNSLGDEKDEAIDTYYDEYMRYFIRTTLKGGRRTAYNQHYKSKWADEVFNIISTELDIKANVCELVDEYCEYTNKHRKIKEDEYDSKFGDYRYINEEKKPNLSMIV